MLNAFYAGVKSVSASNVVLSAGTAPFGDAPGGHRMAPARFLRELLCLSGTSLKTVSCPDPAHFDAIAHHPYAIGGPDYRALNADDVSVADLGKLTRILRRAERTRRALPAGRKDLWVTEFSWDGSPPDPDGVPEARRAQWISEVMQRFWAQGVSHVAWFLIRDERPIPSYGATYQSGLYTFDARPKLALRAFRFPFVVRGGVAWGRAPAAGRLTVQRRSGTRWITVARLTLGRHAVFDRRVSLPGLPVLRAVVAGQASLSYRARSR
jgi:hypothetical protein